MTLRVVNVPDPPPGVDWTYAVPGQYLERITAVQAQLVTVGSSGFPDCPDASGNGNNATYTSGGSTFVAGLVPGNDAIQRNVGQGDQINGTHPIVDVSSAFTFLEWVKFDAPLGSNVQLGGYADSVVNHTGWTLLIPSGFPTQLFVSGSRNGAGNAAQWKTAVGTVPYDSAPHLLAVTFDPAATPQNAVYLDGVHLPFTAPDFPLVYNGPSAGWHFNLGSPKVTDELAIVPGVLTVGQIAALYAAGGTSFAAYNAAVLALSPHVYYHLDGRGAAATGRVPTLIATDGTAVVGDFGSGFGPGSGSPPYAFSWVLDASSNTELADGTVVTAGIPPLLLPAGYTLGTLTPDLVAGDQWSAVTVWWNDDAMNALDAGRDYVFPGGIRLIYERARVTP